MCVCQRGYSCLIFCSRAEGGCIQRVPRSTRSKTEGPCETRNLFTSSRSYILLASYIALNVVCAARYFTPSLYVLTRPFLDKMTVYYEIVGLRRGLMKSGYAFAEAEAGLNGRGGMHDKPCLTINHWSFQPPVNSPQPPPRLSF